MRQPFCIDASMDLFRKLCVPLEADTKEPEWKLIGSAVICYHNVFTWSLQQAQALYGLFSAVPSQQALCSPGFFHRCASIQTSCCDTRKVISATLLHCLLMGLFRFLLSACGFALVHVALAFYRYM